MGELGYTGLNELGYPSVVAVNTGGGVLTKVGSVQGRTGMKYRWGSYHYLFLS